MEPTNWKCPYCGHAQTVTNTTYNDTKFRIGNDLSRYGEIGGRAISIVCSNSDCKEITLNFYLHKMAFDGRKWVYTLPAHHSWLSLPFIPSIAETLEFCITTGYPFRHEVTPENRTGR